MNTAPEIPDPTARFKPFSQWTDEEIRNRAAELHGSDMVLVDETRPIHRDDDEIVYVPAWIELGARD